MNSWAQVGRQMTPMLVSLWGNRNYCPARCLCPSREWRNRRGSSYDLAGHSGNLRRLSAINFPEPPLLGARMVPVPVERTVG